MNRRHLLLAGGALAAAPLAACLAPAPPATPALRTQWKVRTSEGFDAICFLNPLAGDEFYTRYYAAELAAFTPRLKPQTLATIRRWFDLVKARGGLLGPQLCTLMSGAPYATLGDLLAGLADPERIIRPAYQASPYWDADSWTFFTSLAPDLTAIFEDMRAAGFAQLRDTYMASRAAAKTAALDARLAATDTIAEQERLLGRRFPDPSLEIILLWFSKPHGIRIQGQRFLTHVEYSDDITIRNANHEMLHPPFDMEGPLARSIIAAMNADPLLARILAEHDPRFGYNSMEGILNEDTVQALEQIVNERTGVGVAPPLRWRQSDDGMHVFAAGLYGHLKTEGYDRTGGNIEQWMAGALSRGLFAPAALHASAARVLERPADALWPLT